MRCFAILLITTCLCRVGLAQQYSDSIIGADTAICTTKNSYSIDQIVRRSNAVDTGNLIFKILAVDDSNHFDSVKYFIKNNFVFFDKTTKLRLKAVYTNQFNNTFVKILEVKFLQIPNAKIKDDHGIFPALNNKIVFKNLSLQNYSGGVNGFKFTWDFGDGSDKDSSFDAIHHFPEITERYSVVLKLGFDNTCFDTDTCSIFIYEGAVIYIPNAFTPDGAGIVRNEYYNCAVRVNLKSYSMSIFSHQGHRIFYTTDYRKGWDGNFNGQQCSQGYYLAKFDYETIFGQKGKAAEYVYLLR